MIGLELKQKAEEHAGKKQREERRRREWREKQEEEKCIVWEGKEWAIASAAVLRLVSGLVLIRMSGRPFPLAPFC